MIKKKLIKNAKKIDKFLIRYLNRQDKSLLINPMKYGVISGGKKIRSTVIFNVAKIFNLNKKKMLNICGAVELIHAYSLVHDDMPTMDDDDLRRGKPSCHKAFDEVTALLAGDALQSLAFSVLAEHLGHNSPNVVTCWHGLPMPAAHSAWRVDKRWTGVLLRPNHVPGKPANGRAYGV